MSEHPFRLTVRCGTAVWNEPPASVRPDPEPGTAVNGTPVAALIQFALPPSRFWAQVCKFNPSHSDFDEVFIYHTNPLLADTDGDGFTDGEEVSFGSDPLNADSTPLSIRRAAIRPAVNELAIIAGDLSHIAS